MNPKIRLFSFSLIIFLTASLIILYFANKATPPDKVAAKVTEDLQRELGKLNADAASILADLAANGAAPLHSKNGFSFYLISDFRVTKWNDHHFVPTVSSVQGEFTIKLLKEGNSDYIAKKWKIGDNQALIGIITLVKKYNITNNYLQAEWNKKIFPSSNINVTGEDDADGFPVCINNECPFRIKFTDDNIEIHGATKVIAVIFLFISIILLIALFYQLAKTFFIEDFVFLSLAALMIGLRFIMTSLEFPSFLIPGELFNPLVFASSNINASLGDLLINEVALFFLCLYLFRNFFLFRSIRFMQKREVTHWILSVAAGFFVLLAMLYPFVVIQTLYNNSTITLSITESLRFEGLRIAALLVILIGGLCSFLFSHTFIRLLVADENRIRIIVSFMIAVMLFFITNYLSGQLFLSSLVVAVLYFLIVYFLKLAGSMRHLSFATFTYLFVSIFFISLNSAYAMNYFSKNEKINSQFRFARDFLINRDNFAEYLLRELSQKIEGDAFIQSRMATPFLGKDAVKQKIRQIFLPSYFNKYDVEINIFNAAGEGIENRITSTFSELVANYNSEANKTEYDGVYFINSPEADITQKYLVVVPVYWMKSIAGHIVLEFSLKKVIPENVYPELLVDNRFLKFYRAQELSYGLYLDNKLSYSAGEYNYEGSFNTEWFGDPNLHTRGITRAGYDHIAAEDELGRIAVVSSRTAPYALIMANFSFFIVIGLVTILIFILVQGLTSYLQGVKLYFAARIQLFLNLAFFLPLIIVSIMSLQVTSRSSKNQLNDEYLDKTKRFSEKVSGELHQSLIGISSPAESFENKLADLAMLTNLDANVYNSSGHLIAASQPLIFENKLYSQYINPVALQNVLKGSNYFIQTEKVGTLEYYTAYASLRAPSSGALIGVVSIPFFQSLYSGERVQINILANILNIFALIFIGLVVLSYVVTQWLTFPLTFITQSLRKTSLTKTNQPLVWKADDEIGLMVKEYNQMLFKLSESKAELEQTQRERAWREIAQQVAHEIKNPLTPMKLTLQQLERLIQAGKASPEKTEKAVSSLLTQVNTLNEIASSFSSFAKMPEPVMKELEIISLLKRIVDLHSHTGDLRFHSRHKDLRVMGDEQLLGRTFSNIILNALQAALPGTHSVVVISVEKQEQKVLVSFRDNGKGIEPGVAERIFVPHFTTKKSGSGLGLAIAKQAIEQMDGNLWFETQPSKGTTFFIELPLLPEPDHLNTQSQNP